MKRLNRPWALMTLIAMTAGLLAGGAHAQSYVNVNVGGVLAPGVFGEISFGSAPPPPVFNPAPVIIVPTARPSPPVYLYVPEEHRREWARYCANYRACDRPVQFVQVDERDRWWERHEGHGRRDWDRRDERDDRRDDRHEDRGRHEGEWRGEHGGRGDHGRD